MDKKRWSSGADKRKAKKLKIQKENEEKRHLKDISTFFHTSRPFAIASVNEEDPGPEDNQISSKEAGVGNTSVGRPHFSSRIYKSFKSSHTL